MINLIIQLPATDAPTDVVNVLDGHYDESDPPVWIAGAGFKTEIPPNGIMPSSAVGGGKHLVNCVVSGAAYQEILDVTFAQRPVWLIFGAQDLLPSPNPDYDPDDPNSEPTITVVHEPLNPSVWALMPDRPIYDSGGNQTGTEQQTALHEFQGCAAWPSR